MFLPKIIGQLETPKNLAINNLGEMRPRKRMRVENLVLAYSPSIKSNRMLGYV